MDMIYLQIDVLIGLRLSHTDFAYTSLKLTEHLLYIQIVRALLQLCVHFYK